jgi:cysteine-rich repeat protein
MPAVLVAGLIGGCALDRSGLGEQTTTAGVSGGAGGISGGAAQGTGGSGAADDGGGGGAGGASPGVGDCVLGTGEECDDCNTASGDGCDESGQIEPGWVCPVPGDPCLSVSVDTVASGVTTEVGDLAAQPSFAEDCPAGMLLVGIEATDSGDWPGGGEYLSYVAPRCAAPVVQADHSFTWAMPVTGAAHGGVDDCCVQNVTPYVPLSCPSDRFAIGFRARESGYLTTMSLLCARMSLNGSSVALGTTTITVGPMGTDVGADSGDIACPAGSAAVSLTGSAGAVLDRVGLGCATIGVTLEPAP